MEGNEHTSAKDLFHVIRKSPALMITFVVGGLLLLYILIKHGANQGSSQQQAQGSDVPVSSQGSYYQQPEQTFIIPMYLPYGAMQGGVGGGSPAVQSSDPSASAPSLGTSSGTSTIPSNYQHEIGLIRTKGNSPTASSYDASHSGVPIRSQPGPGNDIIGNAGYGQPVTITGQPVQGGNNFGGNNPNGSDQWYPVQTSSGQTGYVSGYDVQSTSVSGGGSANQSNTQNTSVKPGTVKTMTR